MLEEQRNKIDAIDVKLAALLEQRLHVSEEIAQAKYKHHLGLTDRGREAVLLEKVVNSIQAPNLRPYVKDLYKDILLISKQLQANTIKALQDADK
ncbi:hypothetical protein FC83_GL000629 [Agrilactobacillus composti DSM 18527 = JCM 14202]|uniref:Chorismate mutase domain-containing protein n=1 Tax=Agrilactobacillus composti DSM 18527 = JCM 14202 TaxID=1423734 RepID=X0PDY7_9LACO|nr:chorismate mutase [Agrilactobacillus composti]KRM31568.1 hypothetical protein FC83_GL000629 [Agrilactobacillus composti DSM 18527 = JCM 14202]GAF39408.1 hypothetical protein JCM14202_1271 [Agrilactobacillus composti DSM 18527 = JCM 14202]